MAVAVQSVCPR